VVAPLTSGVDTPLGQPIDVGQTVIRWGMPSRALSVRLDGRASQALDELEAVGLTRSEAIRLALVETAARLRRGQALASEAASLEVDEGDRMEMLAVARIMEACGRRGAG